MSGEGRGRSRYQLIKLHKQKNGLAGFDSDSENIKEHLSCSLARSQAWCRKLQGATGTRDHFSHQTLLLLGQRRSQESLAVVGSAGGFLGKILRGFQKATWTNPLKIFLNERDDHILWATTASVVLHFGHGNHVSYMSCYHEPQLSYKIQSRKIEGDPFGKVRTCTLSSRHVTLFIFWGGKKNRSREIIYWKTVQ